MGDVSAPTPDVTLRRGILVVVAAAALTAALAGLARLGYSIAWGPSRVMEHGPLFVLGAFGTVIGLERAVALARPWSFAAPALGAAAAVGMLAGLPWAPWAAAASSVALIAVNAAVVRRQSVAFTWVMLLGSALLAVGAVAWALGRTVFDVVPAWMGFFVLTIAAERLELSRLAPTPRWASRAIVALSLALALTASLAAFGVAGASRALGVALALVGAWQLRYDLARRTLRQRALPRFAASGVLLGAAWLVVTGALLARAPLPPAGPLYDAALHGVFVGYVLSMVFAHAPIILPAVARVKVPFHPVLYVPLAALHLGLLLRVAGDLTDRFAWRQHGGALNALSLALFFAAVLWSRLAAR